jgi:hypothetical protein
MKLYKILSSVCASLLLILTVHSTQASQLESIQE